MQNNDTPDRRRWLTRAVLIALGLGAAGFMLRNVILGTPVTVYRAARGDIVQSIVASGRIATPQRVSVGAVVTGRVTSIPVQEGQDVRRGEILIKLEDDDERASVDQARATVAQAEAKVRQLRELGLPAAEQTQAQAQANYMQARRQHDRSRELMAKGFLSQAALDDAQRNLEVAESQLRAARLQVASSRPEGSDFALAQTALAQARSALGLAQARLEETVIRAPVDGTLIARSVEPGNVVQSGKELMILAPAGEVQIVVQIDEKNLGQLKLGQRALASADAFSKERFTAELVYVNPGIDALRGSVETKLRVPNPPHYLRQDMTVSVDIEVAKRSGTVVIPADAVHDVSGEPWVLAVDGRRVRRRQVKLGLKGEGSIEVLEGIAPDEYLISANGTVRDGQRVRVLAPPRGGAS